MKKQVRTIREYVCDIIEDNTETKAFGCINCDKDESHIVFNDDNTSLFLSDIETFINKYLLSPYNISHNEIGDCCGCFTIIDNCGIIRCNECGKTLRECLITNK